MLLLAILDHTKILYYPDHEKMTQKLQIFTILSQTKWLCDGTVLSNCMQRLYCELTTFY